MRHCSCTSHLSYLRFKFCSSLQFTSIIVFLQGYILDQTVTSLQKSFKSEVYLVPGMRLVAERMFQSLSRANMLKL